MKTSTSTLATNWFRTPHHCALPWLAGLAFALNFVLSGNAASTSWNGVPVVQPIMPPDAKVPVSQFNFDNLAWQQFITLNWAADTNSPGNPDTNVPPSSFGTPLDTTPVVWESFKEPSEVFLTNGAPPPPWSAMRTVPPALARLAGRAGLRPTSKLGIKGLVAPSKFTDGPTLDLSEIAEAFTGGAWLTAQARMNNYVTLFEKRLNQDEFNYITVNKLYDAANQAPFALASGINLPDGSPVFASYGTVGAIETKAAWIQLDDPSLWPLFKTSKAYVSYPSTNGQTPPKLVTVGLVALHIIRKTPNAQQFVWSTFEHVNNAPSVADLQNNTLKSWYTYYNANCDPSTDHYQCKSNTPPRAGIDPYNAPVQVVRTTPIDPTSGSINTNVWKTIAAANPKSVFLNYQLVNVLWPNDNTTITNGAPVPLTDGNPQPPPSQPVANAVLETYHQSIHCLNCHTGAAVAAANGLSRTLKVSRPAAAGRRAAPASGASAPLASDYSFLFGEAQTQSTAKTPGTKP